MFEPSLRKTRDERSAAARPIDDRLYGKLLEVNAQLKDAGGMLIVAYALLLLTTYLALWFGWYESLDWFKGMDLNVVWTYLIVLVVVFFVWIKHFQFAQWRCYRRNRPELFDQLRRAAMGRHQLLALIARDELLTAVAEALQRDRRDEGVAEFFPAHAR